MDAVRSPSGWVHPKLYGKIDGCEADTPGALWKEWSESIERSSRRWVVRTLASRYRLDLSAGTVTRLVLDEPDAAPVAAGLVPHNLLAGDGEPLVLLAVLDCRVEQPMLLLLELDAGPGGEPGPGRVRVTTPVVAIYPERVGPEDS